jgi:hypothetical protein
MKGLGSRFCLWFKFGVGFWVQGSVFRVQGSGFRVEGSGFGVRGEGFKEKMAIKKGVNFRAKL